MFKPSRRAFGVATAFTISAVILAPAASAALLGSGGSSGSALPVPALSGLTDVLPLSGNLLQPVQDLLGPGVGVGGLLGAGQVLGGLTGIGGLTNLGGPVLQGVGLSGGGLPGLGSADGADGASGELLDGVFQSVGGTTVACDAAAPQLLQALGGDVAGSLCELNPFDGGLVGLLGSL